MTKMTTKDKVQMNEKEVLVITEKFLSLMDVGAKATVFFKDKTGFLVNIDAGQEAGLLIGNRGRTLQSFQHLLSMMLNKGKMTWIRVTVDVASWREKEEKRLVGLAKQTAERTRISGEPQNLYNLSAIQRRSVHMALADEKDIKTESLGEGKDRYLVISPK